MRSGGWSPNLIGLMALWKVEEREREREEEISICTHRGKARWRHDGGWGRWVSASQEERLPQAPPCGHPDLRLATSRTLSKWMSLVEATPAMVFTTAAQPELPDRFTLLGLLVSSTYSFLSSSWTWMEALGQELPVCFARFVLFTNVPDM